MKSNFIRFTVFLILACLVSWQAGLRADGLIIVNDPNNPRALRLKYHHVDVKIRDLTAETSVDEEFENPTGQRLEGTYLFPVPAGAILKKFSMFINGQEMQAELLSADKARTIYEDIVRRQKDPGLLEYIGRDVFKVRIFPIDPRSTKRVKISYAEALLRDSGTVSYSYPLGTEKFSSENIDEVTVRIDIETTDRLGSVTCLDQAVKIERQGLNGATAVYSARNVRPDRDLSLSFTSVRSGPGALFLAHRIEGDDGYFRLNITPDLSLKDVPSQPKDITFVLDTSGSMAGEKLDQAKAALLFCVRSLNVNDRFEIVRFSTEAEALFGLMAPADRENVGKAESFISGFNATGGTAMAEALRLSLAGKKTEGRSRIVVFITDGKPTIGETAEDAILGIVRQDSGPAARVFPFGVGYDINTHLLDRIAEITKSVRTYVEPKEDIEVKVSNFFKKISDPVLTDLTLTFTGPVSVSKSYPSLGELPDLFKDSDLSIVGRFKGDGPVKAVLEGMANGKKQRFEFDVNFPKTETANDLLPSFWAFKRIGYLLDQIRLHGSEQELVDEVTGLARKFGIVTPYTSWLILEDEARQVRDNRLDRDQQIFGSAVPQPAPEMMEKSKKSYDAMKEQSGAGSVRASRSIQNFNSMETLPGVGGGSRSEDEPIAMEKRVVNGRTFFKTSEGWNDPEIRTLNDRKVVRIGFGGDEYFELLKNDPGVAAYLSLGGSVRFLHKGTVYIVSEK